MISEVETREMGSIRALVVDDNAFDRRRLKRVADESDLDITVVEACDGREFRKRMGEHKFDVIYVDLDLAGEDGTKLHPQVRSHPVNGHAAMIMVAGADQASAALSAIRAGFADYIEKDELSAASLSRATVNALQKVQLTNAAVSAEADTKSVETVLKAFSDVCTQEMRPMVARMMRQIRQIRADVERNGADASGLLEVENTCSRMEEFFQDLGSLATDGMLSSIVESQEQIERTSITHRSD